MAAESIVSVTSYRLVAAVSRDCQEGSAICMFSIKNYFCSVWEFL